ncbi:MAG: VCBS repeat-containing protein, partial [Acidobacteriaceae bacterium]
MTIGAGADNVLGQRRGVVGHVIEQNISRPTNHPFNAYFVDVAKEAGLHEPVIYGAVDRIDYILEADGCGCAFIDYDNDGWMDLFILSGSRLTGNPPNATNRLYKNNRDGTFRDVTEEAGLHHAGWANSVCVGDFNNDGFEDM